MNDYSSNDWLRPSPSFIARIAALLWDMLVVLAILWAIGWIISKNEAFAQPRTVCPKGSVCVLLENSMQPATLSECQAARPKLGRPYFTASKRLRSNEPYHGRVCFFRPVSVKA